MKSIHVLRLGVLFLAGCGSSASGPQPRRTDIRLPPAATAVHARIALSGGRYAFMPRSITIIPGTIVVWTNDSKVAHTITAAKRGWSSPRIAPGHGYTRAFTAAARYRYTCMIHPYMTGVIIVGRGSGA